MNKVFLFVFIVLFGCNKKTDHSKGLLEDAMADSATTQFDSVQKVLHNDTIPVVDDSEPEDGKYSKVIKDNNISAEIFYKVENGHVDYYDLKVYDGKNIQKLDAVSDWGFSSIDQTEFSFEDVNFDGKNDILIAKEIGMNWGTTNVWINKNGKFVKEKIFGKIKNLQIDAEKREITSAYRIAGEGQFSETYKWKNGRLILVNSSEYIYGPDGN